MSEGCRTAPHPPWPPEAGRRAVGSRLKPWRPGQSLGCSVPQAPRPSPGAPLVLGNGGGYAFCV